jgi:hypothetical protein
MCDRAFVVVLNEIGESGVRGREVSGECSHESLSGGSEVGTAEEEMVVIRDGEIISCVIRSSAGELFGLRRLSMSLRSEVSK